MFRLPLPSLDQSAQRVHWLFSVEGLSHVAAASFQEAARRAGLKTGHRRPSYMTCSYSESPYLFASHGSNRAFARFYANHLLNNAF